MRSAEATNLASLPATAIPRYPRRSKRRPLERDGLSPRRSRGEYSQDNSEIRKEAGGGGGKTVRVPEGGGVCWEAGDSGSSGRRNAAKGKWSEGALSIDELKRAHIFPLCTNEVAVRASLNNSPAHSVKYDVFVVVGFRGG